MTERKILFLLTGSIAAYKACEVISQLVKSGHQVQTCCSKSALQFIGAATLEGLTGKPVVSDLYQAGNMMDHIHLVRWADLIITAPATANFINKMANGIGDDLLSTMCLAHDYKKPFLIFPAMNTAMYENPITQRSLTNLKSLGIQVMPTNSGNLACGEIGTGRLLEPNQIIGKIQDLLQTLEQKQNVDSTNFLTDKSTAKILTKPANKRKVLITAGGTQEPIDAVRVLTNLSTGATGARIAEQLIIDGYDVTYLHSAAGKIPKQSCRSISFTSFADIYDKMKSLLQQEYFDLIIHAAAISDFTVKADSTQIQSKISSEQDLILHLSRNPKIVDQLKNWSLNPDCKVIAFKMTANADDNKRIQAVTKVFKTSLVDYVVQNDISEIKLDRHHFQIFKNEENSSAPTIQKIADLKTKNELAAWFADLLSQNDKQNIHQPNLNTNELRGEI